MCFTMKYLTLNNNFLKYFYSLSAFVVGVILFTNEAYAQGSCDIIDPVTGHPNTVQNLVCSLTRSINILLILGGVIFSFVIVLGAYKYFTSMGDPKGIMGARNTLTYGVLGFLIVTAAFAIVLLIGSILGVDIGNPVLRLREGICNIITNISTRGDIVEGAC